MRMLALTLSAALGLALPGRAASDVIVIVSVQSQVTTMTPDQVAALFLGKIAALPDGTKLAPLNQLEGAPIRDEFYSRVVGKTPSQVKAFWSKMIFSGKGQPPAELNDDTAVRKNVAAHPGTVGYIDRANLDATVRAVTLSER
jgi:ABC-type phosphate transport system substrate-binding protein